MNMVPSDLASRRDVPPPRLHRHDRPASDARRGARVPRRQGPEEAREADRQAARPPAARGAVGDQALATSPATTRSALEQPASDAAEARRRCGTTGSASASRTTCPTTRSSATSSPPRAATARRPRSGSRSSRRSTSRPRRASRTDYPEKKTLDLFWRRQQQVPIEQWGEKVAAAFLGVRLECAQCHKHPTDRWTQDEYWAFANVFAQVTFVQQPVQHAGREARRRRRERATRRRRTKARTPTSSCIVREMFVAPSRQPRCGRTPRPNRVPTPKALGGPEIPRQGRRRRPREARRVDDRARRTRSSPAAS